MKILFTGIPKLQPRVLMMKAGYGEKITRLGKVSYTRRLRGTEFPRFHAYLDIKEKAFQINLHLDQKGACYAGTSAHSGEYDGKLVELEGERIKEIIDTVLFPPDYIVEAPSTTAGSTPFSGDMRFG